MRVDEVDFRRVDARVLERAFDRERGPQPTGVRRGHVAGVARRARAQELHQRSPRSRSQMIERLEHQGGAALAERHAGPIGSKRPARSFGHRPQRVESGVGGEAQHVGAAGERDVHLAAAHRAQRLLDGEPSRAARGRDGLDRPFDAEVPRHRFRRGAERVRDQERARRSTVRSTHDLFEILLGLVETAGGAAEEDADPSAVEWKRELRVGDRLQRGEEREPVGDARGHALARSSPHAAGPGGTCPATWVRLTGVVEAIEGSDQGAAGAQGSAQWRHPPTGGADGPEACDHDATVRGGWPIPGWGGGAVATCHPDGYRSTPPCGGRRSCPGC